jgi:hypothetical protein
MNVHSDAPRLAPMVLTYLRQLKDILIIRIFASPAIGILFSLWRAIELPAHF